MTPDQPAPPQSSNQLPRDQSRHLSREAWIAIAIYVVGLFAYALPSGARLRVHSNDNHFVHLAYGWLHGRLDLGGPPPHSNDWSQLEWVTTKDGRLYKGVYVSGSAESFRTIRGKVVEIPAAEVVKRETKYYVSFPPFPAVLMLPIVVIGGMNTNDVLFTVLLAPIAPALLFLLLRRLRKRNYSQRSERDDLWLTSILGVGSVYWFCSVRGEVWYTAHVVSVILVVLYATFALEARRPFWAGFCVVAGMLTRPEILFTIPLFLFELARVNTRPREPHPVPNRPLMARLADFSHRLDYPAVRRAIVVFGIPIAILGCGAAVLNVLRFGRPSEFGHTYLAVIQQAQIQKYGLFNLTYLGRNLACAFALTPSIVAGPPWIHVSWHGLAIWVTTPVVFYLLWPREKGVLHRALWITVACVAIPDLLYQNSGWVQFGYRFSLDYLVFLILLLAVGGRPLTRQFKLLCLYAFAINLFGAITFYWASQYYFNSYFPPGIN